MKLETRLGILEINENDIIDFPLGLLGFSKYHRYIVIEQEEDFFSFLQSVDEPTLTFVIMIPEIVCSQYFVKLEQEEIELLQLETAEDGLVYGIVTVPHNIAEMTVNLQAPLVINTKKKRGAQIINSTGTYHTKHNVLAEMHKNVFIEEKRLLARQKVSSPEVSESV